MHLGPLFFEAGAGGCEGAALPPGLARPAVRSVTRDPGGVGIWEPPPAPL